jgi:protoheme IX farnesyltransferase
MTGMTVSHARLRLRQYLVLTKPRVTQLAVFCAVIGMFLAAPGMPPLQVIVAATIGIWLLAAAAFAVNCLIEQQIDSRMARTRHRATARGDISPQQTLMTSGVLGGIGMFILYTWVNPLTMWLTFATFVGYAVIYTVLLKPRTPQNIVIGGLSGAMPPALGWAAVADAVPAQAWLLVLIIFVWTPPQRRLRQRRPAHAAGHSWQPLHPAAYPAVFGGPARDHAAALCHPHERRGVSGGGRHTGPVLRLVCLAPVSRL